MVAKNDYSTTDTAVTYGSSKSLAITIVSSSTTGLKSASDKASANGWSTFTIDACVSTLKSQNNITGNLEVIIYNKASNFDNPVAAEVRNNLSVSFAIVNPTTGALFDLTKCSSSPTTIGIPVPAENKLRELQTTTATKFSIKPVLYNKMIQAGLDIYNTNDEGFTDRCHAVIDPDSGADTTINYRIQNYFQGVTINCTGGCTYNNIDPQNNVQCACNGIPNNIYITLNAATINPVSDFNLDLFNCNVNAFGTTIGNNPAFWLSTALIIIMVLLTPCLVYVQYFTECQVTNGYGEKLANSSHIQVENISEAVKRRRDASEYEHSFCNLFWLKIKEEHIFLSVFAHKSLAYPVWIRFMLLIFNLNLMFSFSAFMFTDNLVANRATAPNSDTRDTFFYPISMEMDRVALILVFTYIFVEFFKFFLKRLPADLLVQMESAATGGDMSKAHEDVKEYNRRMKVKNSIFFFIILCLNFLGWYYMIVFNGVYTTLASGWAFGALNALILDWFGFSIVIILIKTVILSCLKKS
jgi:hypothetical protein